MTVGTSRFLGMGAGSRNDLPALFFGVGGRPARTSFVRQALQPQFIEALDPAVNRSLRSILLPANALDFLSGLSQPDRLRSFHFDGGCGLGFDQFFECFTLLFG